MTETLRRMTREGVRRLEQLEILLQMSTRPEATWTAARLAQRSFSPLEAAASALDQLAGKGLVTRTPEPAEGFRLGEKFRVDELDALRRLYERDRARVTNAFFTCNLDALREFAESFRLRRSD